MGQQPLGRPAGQPPRARRQRQGREAPTSALPQREPIHAARNTAFLRQDTGDAGARARFPPRKAAKI